MNPSANFDARAFRDALGCFPTGVAVITTTSGSLPVGLTCNSFSSVSLDPPLVLWSLRKGSKSLKAFQEAKGFAINILAEDQNQISGRFASSTIAEKFEGVSWRPGVMGLPVLAGSVATFECVTSAEHDAGDHVIFVGHVQQFDHAPADEPLVFYRGAYMMVARSLREMSAKGEIVPRDLDEARTSLYRVLLPLACARGTDYQFQKMEDILRKMEGLNRPEDHAPRAALAIAFFRAIAEASENIVLAVMAESLTTLMHHAARASVPDAPLNALLDLRWKILNALKERRADVAIAALEGYAAELRVVATRRESTPA